MMEDHLDCHDEQERTDETKPGKLGCEHEERAENDGGEHEHSQPSGGNHNRNDESGDGAARNVQDRNGDEFGRIAGGESNSEDRDETRRHEDGAPEQHLCVGALGRIGPSGEAENQHEAEGRKDSTEHGTGHPDATKGRAEHPCEFGRQHREDGECAYGPRERGEKTGAHVMWVETHGRAVGATRRCEDEECSYLFDDNSSDEGAPRHLLGARRHEWPTYRA